ncbi:hypothetical protein SAMN05880590_11325 [Rhizobium sp. RU35A]|uniref:Transposase n=1 Tax=Rhizobium straminoryzae TaxID=1387186 RepID=A0A549TIS9_9HYPH|nr:MULTISPECIES: hypothetical protein [Rhizobium]TRL43466.1 hypothetical protein FNA46_00210 [Rhizobium straminoryzae]SIR16959.1 hypothetical protein SAMN05880590_11325 [Rhizobium sp. RU35A]
MTNSRGRTGRNDSDETIAYICQMLAELRVVADRQGAEMLCYLIEMAYVEANDLQSGRRRRSIDHRQGDKSPDMPV